MDKKVSTIIIIIAIVLIVIFGIYEICKVQKEKKEDENNTNTDTTTSSIVESDEELNVNNNVISEVTDNTVLNGTKVGKDVVIQSNDATKLKELLKEYDYKDEAKESDADFEITLPDGTKYYIFEDDNGVVKEGKKATLTDEQMEQIEDILDAYTTDD